jgi:hypothetical protein
VGWYVILKALYDGLRVALNLYITNIMSGGHDIGRLPVVGEDIVTKNLNSYGRIDKLSL